MLSDKDPEKAARVMKAMMQMTKIEIAALKKAYES
jgi:two-component system sensor histidine kinase QseC